MNKSLIALLIVALFVAGLIGGFFLGRAFPAHHYQPYAANVNLALDTSTGKVCRTSGLPPRQRLHKKERETV